ncbi:hypothetical protein A3C37_01370 [Candidatus Peribacteria bacterium RIFCSPHIGHO2_02_FULL_53_20]|nr:MAG: hypothetical protein A3C37_01370 [Candidatus Peribacteria bacterium RIFCSPHIGHO2_02_FULL_53_20]OGJ67621.1 MAG: hypothetical protein A3B61_02060 [Candidatus Peribacteria bacterium RIFCSPLOWO2_01_FULL_53_10]OGJ74991.1 MAG: hypothetical protein A3G69_00685 [Candidatus Peribacteria bacterium RIFCSPLOWO2_12_FULL_53_10]
MTFWNVAERDLERFPHALRKILLLGCREIFDDWGIGKMLTGSLSGYRMHGSTSLTTSRVSVYRVIYVVKGSSHIEIVAIGHRRDIYERVKKR